MKPNYKHVSYLSFSSSRRFGIELEMGHTVPKLKVSKIIKNYSSKEVNCTGYKLSSNNNFWHVKDDSTCGIFGKNGPKGVEVASYVAQGIEDVDHISFVGRMLSLAGCKTNPNCGLHIHADVSDLNVNQVGTILSYWLKIEGWVESMVPEHRRNSKYCRSLCSLKNFDKSVFWKPQDLFVLFSPKNLGTFENEDRRVTLNLVNYVKYVLFPNSNNSRCTLELRCPEGTLDYNEIKNWTYFFLNFLEFCKRRGPASNLLPCSDLDEFLFLSGLSHDNETFYVFDKELFDTRNWLLKRLMMYGTSTMKRSAKKKSSFLNDSTLDNK